MQVCDTKGKATKYLTAFHLAMGHDFNFEDETNGRKFVDGVFKRVFRDEIIEWFFKSIAKVPFIENFHWSW